MFNKLLLALAVMLAATQAFACGTTFSNPTVSFASPTMGVGYATITAKDDDTLTALRSGCCDAVELHSTTMEDGVMKMRKLDTLALKAGKPVAITKAGGMHLMLIGPHATYKPGDPIYINFTFANAGVHTQLFTVGGKGRKPAAKDTPAGHDMDGMGHAH